MYFDNTMNKTDASKDFIKLVFEMTVFMILLLPGILLAGLKKLLPPKQKSVKGQVVLITGTARGLGRELAMTFGKLGAKVACVDVLEDENNETAMIIKSEGNIAVSYKCDVSKRDQIKALHDRVREDMGPVDMLINNAGLVGGHFFIDYTQDQFIVDCINVNLLGQFWMIREILPSMMKRNSGHIVAISSLSSLAGTAGLSSYTASKWGVNGMMGCLQAELRDEFNSNVKTTTVMPYFVETNPKISAMLNIRIPEIPTHVAGKLIVQGILEEQKTFSVPKYIEYVCLATKLLPDNLQKMLSEIIHIKFVPTVVGQEIINEYKQPNTCAN